MAAPNIVNVSTILGRTAVANIETVLLPVIENQSSSGNVIKVNSILVSNIDTSNTSNVSINFVRSGASYSMIKNVNIPITSSIDLISKSVYLEEGDGLSIEAEANLHSQAVVSYEIIS